MDKITVLPNSITRIAMLIAEAKSELETETDPDERLSFETYIKIQTQTLENRLKELGDALVDYYLRGIKES